ncbi:MAG: response regulator transcription factor [Gemmatimonadaceae bacterium]|nr:response regulator transcription factor [Gemmatimonadaceae bacterium]
MLVVEDDTKTAETIALYLRHEGFRVTHAPDGVVGRHRVAAERFDLVILDRMLPGADGIDVCRHLREHADTPVIMLTAMVDEHDRLEGFAAGVDDYVPKPFSPRELVARAHAVLRRVGVQRDRREGSLRLGTLYLAEATREAWLGERALALSPTEFRLLWILAATPGRVCSRSELSERALRSAGESDLRTVDAHVKNLRRKLDPGGPADACIETIFAVGYRLLAGAFRHA